MEFLKRLFKRGDEPNLSFTDSTLGDFTWDVDEESWVGAYKSFKVLLSYENEANPTPEIVSYAKSIVTNSNWLESTMNECQKTAKSTYPVSRHAEIDKLEYRRLCFQGDNMILIQFFEEDHEPYWSADIVGTKLKGIGCDT